MQYFAKMSLLNFILGCSILLGINIGLIGSAPTNSYNGGTFSEFKFNISGIIRSHGYPGEDHNVLTEDGYILEMQRIPYGRNDPGYTSDRPAVFLMHGLMGSAMGYISLGPEYSLSYILADAGYDVWMGNARGTRNSRFHLTLDPDHEQEQFEFFDFTFDEIGAIDVAEMVDYILEFTGKEKIHYIGHSQGGTVYLVLTSLRPEFNDKFYSAHLFAGVGYMEYFPTAALRVLASSTNIIYSLALRMGIVEVFPPNSTQMVPGLPLPFPTEVTKRSDYCVGNLEHKEICHLFGIDLIMEGTNEDDPYLDIEYESGGAALKQIAHYGQNLRDKLFRRWDYGSSTNLEIYGTNTPPEYDLSLITTKTTMHYTVADILLDERDVLAMAAVMPNTTVRKVDDDTFTHEDFSASRLARDLVFTYVIEEMNKEIQADSAESLSINSASIPSVGALLQVILLCWSMVIFM